MLLLQRPVAIMFVEALEIRLDLIELGDQVRRDIGTSRFAFELHFLRFDEFATSMGPASQTLDPDLRVQRVVTHVVISYRVATIAIEQQPRYVLRLVGELIRKNHRFLRQAAGVHRHV